MHSIVTTSRLPEFKYHPNIYENDIVQHGEGICECCGEKVRIYLTTIYAIQSPECICLHCVKNGSAAKKYDGSFVQDVEKELDTEKMDELLHRTPGYVSWQGEFWLTCCDDYCAYIGEVGTVELEEIGIADEIFAEYDARGEYEDVRSYLEKGGSICGYLFRCLHCQKYHLWVDAE